PPVPHGVGREQVDDLVDEREVDAQAVREDQPLDRPFVVRIERRPDRGDGTASLVLDPALVTLHAVPPSCSRSSGTVVFTRSGQPARRHADDYTEYWSAGPHRNVAMGHF